MTTLLIATHADVFVVDAGRGTMTAGRGLDRQRPTCLAADPHRAGRAPRAWCGTSRGGVFRSDDGGASWHAAGLADRRIMAIAASPAEPDLVWVGTEPSDVLRSADGGESWQPTLPLATLPSSSEWAFPPRPDTHHVRWIACHPTDSGRLWVAVEAGALLSTADGGATWHDRLPGGPYDTHELAIHPAAPDTLRAAAGDGWYESTDGGATWTSPDAGLDVGYLRSVAIDPGGPDVVLVSASSAPRRAYVAGSADGRLYRRAGADPWQRVTNGWPDPPATIAPLLATVAATGAATGEIWAADERGVHRSGDGGVSWQRVAGFSAAPDHLRRLVVIGG
jgi:photosystem II stability/assembly factor-like uncharacterized protein